MRSFKGYQPKDQNPQEKVFRYLQKEHIKTTTLKEDKPKERIIPKERMFL